MEDSVSKVRLVTDEYDPTGVGDSKPRSESIAIGLYGKRGDPSSTIYYETPEQTNSQSRVKSGGPKSFNFEIEPGHLDFLACSSVSYSKPFSSDSGSRKRSSTTGDSCSLSTGHSISSSGNPGNRLSSTTKDNAPNPNLSRAEAHRETRQARDIIFQPLVENYTWKEVEDMTDRAVYKNDEDPEETPRILLGRGGFGNVYMGILAGHNDKPVAVKILGKKTDQGDTEFLNEVNLLSRINHVNLVKLVGYCHEASHRVLVYEYADQGSIGDHLHGTGISLDWKKRLKICLDSAYGLEYLHTGCDPRIIHRDIKSSNILLTKDLVAKVADFGLSKIALEDDSGNRAQFQFSTRVKGTPGYLDPAYSQTGKLDEKSDIYSFGMVLLEMITGRKPNDPKTEFIGQWVRKQSGNLKVIVDSKLGGKFNSKSVKEVHNLALKCTDESPINRPDIRKVVDVLRTAVETENNTLLTPSKWLKSLIGQA